MNSKTFRKIQLKKIDFYLPIGEQVGIYFMLQGDVSAYIVFLEVYNLYIFVYIFFSKLGLYSFCKFWAMNWGGSNFKESYLYHIQLIWVVSSRLCYHRRIGIHANAFIHMCSTTNKLQSKFSRPKNTAFMLKPS